VHSIDKDEQAENANNIVKALKNFGIEISSIKATVGPTITLYEITPAPGVRISKIRNLEDDIAMSLSALCIRIVAPIPGKGTIGIEVPNAHKQIVPMASLLNSRKYKETDMALPLALGKTISNEVYMVDMAKMPHLLVAGATGMGKSVGLNAIITSLLYKMHPAYLKFVMVDPKMVELSLYSVLEKHFLAKLEGEDDPIITDVNKVVRTLKSLCVEMDNRYRLLQMASVRSVKEYNEKYLNKELLPTKGHRFMPYIVVIIDEYGDLMMTAGREVEQPIARIAQKARAVGIHMIIATQRPTTNIITGTIKANFPARMAFRVISTIDSRTILDRSGANQLQGRGDMLFLAGNDPVRVQCALVETKEVERVCAHIAKQQGYPSAYILPEPDEAVDFGDGGSGGSARGDISPDKLDPLFADAARVVVLAQHGSTSLIQRKLEIGFNRAGRIMDQLCRMGIVGEQEGSKPRQVLCADEADLEFRLKSMM
ncbi:MAG: DNA translocase FtsK, partial [Bacteroidaceae bacterium]|nr:DNA translocase FtsK [Bacteroidaceae bacterium]